MASSYDVVGLGIAALDYIGVAASEPQIGAKQQLAQWLQAGGGPVATALVTLARLGMHTCLIGGVGDDESGRWIVSDLQREGVATEGVQVRPGSSHVAFVLAEPDGGRRTIWWHTDYTVFNNLAPSQEMIQAARGLHLDTHLCDTAIQAAHWMHEVGGIVMIDAERPTEAALRLLPLCNYIVVSEHFGQQVTGEYDLARAATILRERYNGIVVVTAGEKGSWCANGDELVHTPAFAVEAVDTTGAGDVFHGGLMYALLDGKPLRDALRFASATAALKCRFPGGRAGIPTLPQVESLLQTYDKAKA